MKPSLEQANEGSAPTVSNAQTLRQSMVALMAEAPRTAREMSQRLSITEREVWDHLNHIQRSLAARNQHLGTQPYVCLECGFRFKERRKHSKPGRCPQCKKGHIAPAVFFIEGP